MVATTDQLTPEQPKFDAKAAVNAHKRRREFVEIDILEAVMDGDIAKAETLAAGMSRDDRAELRDHVRKVMVVLNEADEAEG